MADPVVLKKYASRRLYDTEKKTYVTLAQVAGMIGDGQRVAVFDAKTDEDVTAFVLTQILVEEARKSKTLLPVSLLHLLIECGETALSEFFDKYLELALKNYLGYKKTFDEQFRQWLELGGSLSALPGRSLSSIPSLQAYLDFFSSRAEKRGEGEEHKG